MILFLMRIVIGDASLGGSDPLKVGGDADAKHHCTRGQTPLPALFGSGGVRRVAYAGASKWCPKIIHLADARLFTGRYPTNSMTFDVAHKASRIIR